MTKHRSLLARGLGSCAALLAMPHFFASTAHAQDVDPEVLTKWIEVATPYVLKAVGALVLLVLARIAAGWVGRTIRRVLEARRFDATLTKFFAATARTLVLLAAVLGVLGMFGVETTSFAAVIGAAGLAIGLAFQGTLGNFASGVLLLTFRPFKVGEYVELAGIAGIVDEIELFTTTLLTTDNKKIIIPNTSVTGTTITNYSAMPTRRVDLSFRTEHGADLDATRKVLERVVAGIDKRLPEPESVVMLWELGPSSVDWMMRVWVDSADYWAVREELLVTTKKALDEAKIKIPFPQMSVHVDKPVDDRAA